MLCTLLVSYRLAQDMQLVPVSFSLTFLQHRRPRLDLVKSSAIKGCVLVQFFWDGFDRWTTMSNEGDMSHMDNMGDVSQQCFLWRVVFLNLRFLHRF